MVPQQNQALQMADLATARAHSPQVRRLAATIANEDEPGMAMMQQWLTDSGSCRVRVTWRATVPGCEVT